MILRFTALLLASLLVVPGIGAGSLTAAEADMAGGWSVEFGLPWGGSETMPMWVNQDGTKLSGRLTVIGAREYQLKGTIEEDRFTITWETLLEGEFVKVTFAGRVKGDELSGTAKIGEFNPRELYGRRTER